MSHSPSPNLPAPVTPNKVWLEKADFTTADLIVSGGFLENEQAAAFIRILIKESVLMPMVTLQPMRAPKAFIETFRFGSRVLQAGTEASALPEAERSSPDLTRTELDVQLFKAEVPISDEVFEDNIERDSIRQTIMEELAKAISRDLEDVLLNGDTASATPFFAKLDGIRKQVVSNIVAGGLQFLNNDILNDMIKTMPSEFLRDRNKMVFLTSIDADQDFRNSLADRQTQLGDISVTNFRPVGFSGINIIPVPVYPENLGGGTNETEVILTDPKNIHMGILRRIKIEPDRDARAGVLFLVGTVRADVKFEFEPATVKATAVRVS